MSDRRQVWATLAELLGTVEAGAMEGGIPAAGLEEVRQEVRRLGKAQFKANALVENQAQRWEEALALLRRLQHEESPARSTSPPATVTDSQALLAAILPALDGLEAAMAAGERYLALRDRAGESRRLSEEERARLLSPADRAMLAGWLDGLRLVRQRLLAILEKGEVTPIPTVGQRFDPYLHRAVGTTGEGEGEPNVVVREEQRGYRSPAGILRYADVIVYKPEQDQQEL